MVLSTLFPIAPIATGMRVKPIVVMTDPVTIEGRIGTLLKKAPETRS